MNNGLPPTRILIVDDYPDVLEVWTLYLRAVGFDVAPVRQAEIRGQLPFHRG